MKAITAECEKTEGYRCQVSEFFGGLEYKLIKRMEIKDVRLVYAPGDSIGKYGGYLMRISLPAGEAASMVSIHSSHRAIVVG